MQLVKCTCSSIPGWLQVLVDPRTMHGSPHHAWRVRVRVRVRLRARVRLRVRVTH